MRFWGKHGANPGERDKAQPIEIDLRIELHPRAAHSDDLGDALDYRTPHEICRRITTQRSFALLEALAAACLDEILRDRRITCATIRVRKPRVLDGATPAVELSRSRRAAEHRRAIR